jgi:Protein involved in cellulose biosynthesis (CelD)
MQQTHVLTNILPEQQQDWYKAALGTNQVDPFCCTPVWQLSFHSVFGPKRRVLIETSAHAVLAFAETVFSPEDIFLTPIEAHWFFGCPLIGKHAVDLLAETVPFLETIYAPFFPRIVISGIRPQGALAHRLMRSFGKHFSMYLHGKGVQCSASLAGGVDGFLSRRSGNHRSKLKKDARRARELGISFERVTPRSDGEARETYARMLAVEAASWKGIGQCGMAEPPARQFYDALLRQLATLGAGRVLFARHEGNDIGFIFGAMAGNIYRGQQFSYNNAWKRFSIGNLMQIEKVAWLCEDGGKRYDMGPLDGPRMEYKSHWTEKTAEIQTWILEKA